MHDIGDWLPSVIEFTAATRKTTRLEGARIRVRSLNAEDVTLVDGMPTTSVERTIADLTESREDPSLIAEALQHSAQAGTLEALRRLAPLARHNNAEDGPDLAERLMRSGGVGDAWISRLQ